MSCVLKIREVGDPVLQKVAKKINKNKISDKVYHVIEDMKETLKFGEGYGIAAPQVGVSLCIIVVGAKKGDTSYVGAKSIPVTAMINPVWEKMSDEMITEFEGCLSVPSIVGKVPRYKRIRLTYDTIEGETLQTECTDFLARLIQHECDHLAGITFLEKVEKKDGFCTRDMRKKFYTNKKKKE